MMDDEQNKFICLHNHLNQKDMNHNFRQLMIWKKSIDFSCSIYSLVESFPKTEQFGLTSQITRASVSIPSNIAEGSGRSSYNEFKKFLFYSLGSAYELETQLIIAKRIYKSKANKIQDLINELQAIEKMIFNFQKRL